MKSLLKAFLVFLVLGGVLIAVVVIAFRIFFPIEEVQHFVENRIRQHLNREAHLTGTRLGLRGLSLQHFKLSNPRSFSAGTFLDVENARLGWAFPWPFSKKVVISMQRGTVYLGAAARPLPTTVSDLTLTLSNFNTTRADGQLHVVHLQNPVYVARDLKAEWSLQNLDATRKQTQGWIRLRQGPGQIHNIARLGESSSAAQLVLMPLLMLQNLERTGVVQLGLPDLSRLTITHITGDYTVSAGLLTIQKFAIVGPELTATALGTIRLTDERLAVNVSLSTPKRGRETEAKFSVSGTLSKPQANVDSLKKKAFKATLKNVLENPKTQKKVNDVLKQIF